MARLFEQSVDSSNFSSPIFIKHFMFNDIAKQFENCSILMVSKTTDDIIRELNEEYQEDSKIIVFSKPEMY